MFSFGTEETLVSLKGVVVDTSPSGMLIVDAADTIPDGETDGDPPRLVALSGGISNELRLPPFTPCLLSCVREVDFVSEKSPA